MGRKAGQEFIEAESKLWIDLHTCSTAYAVELFDMKIREAHKYGLSCVVFIYGTPDTYDGSIEEAYDRFRKQGHELVKDFIPEHAGVTASLKENPSPDPKDENMFFSAIAPQYDSSFWRVHAYLYHLYPYRRVYHTAEIARHLGASVDLVRSIARDGYDGDTIPDAELRTVYNEDWKKNLTTWYFTSRSLEKYLEIWDKISGQYANVLRHIGASEEETLDILDNLKSVPIPAYVERTAKAALTRSRKRRED